MPFDIQRTAESERVYRLGLRGELDVESGPRLVNGLRRARAGAARLRLDLSGITFIDCSGLTFLLSELHTARENGWPVEVDREVSRSVRRIIQMTGVAGLVWP